MFRRDALLGFCFATAVLFQIAAVATAAEWPTFRGPDRTGVSNETGLLSAWPEEGPRLVWKIEGTGRGYASVAIVGDRLYTLGDNLSIADDKDEYLMCFNRNTGRPVWMTKTGPAWTDGKDDWQGSRSTPTVDGELVFVITPHGELVCCRSANGKEVWRKHLKSDFGGKKDDIWGYSESVTIDGDNLICTPGGEQATMVCLDKNTGALRWKAVREGDRGAGHASIVKSEVGGVPVYVQTTGGGALGVRATDGELMWSYPIDKTTAVIPTPIVRDDLVFFTAGYNRGGALLKQVADGEGKVTMEVIYPLKPELNNKHGGVVLVGDYLYGDSNDQGIPFCYELMTGKEKWKKRGSGRGSAAVSAADGHLYIRFANGTMVLAKASPDGYEETGSFTPPGSGDRPSWAHPVVLDGKLYLRENDMILCYDVRDPRKSATASTR